MLFVITGMVDIALDVFEERNKRKQFPDFTFVILFINLSQKYTLHTFEQIMMQ